MYLEKELFNISNFSSVFLVIFVLFLRLALLVFQFVWPAASGKRFKGVSDLSTGAFLKFEKIESGNGPVDSIFKAINSVIKNNAKLEVTELVDKFYKDLQDIIQLGLESPLIQIRMLHLAK